MIKRIQDLLLYTLVFLIPINLGKHFIIADSYVKSFLIDYLIPTVWLTDLLVVALIGLWILNRKKVVRGKYFKLLLLFLTSLLPSLALSTRILPSVYAYLSLVLHTFFALVIATSFNTKKNFKKIVLVLSFSVVLVSLLGLFQWVNQGSVFDSYKVLGEQPYNITTENIALVNVFGQVKIPVYGLFRHPNIFAGFLAISLFWIYTQILLGDKRLLFKWALFVGFITLLLTFSETALFSLVIAMVFFKLIKNLGKKGVLISLSFTFLLVMVGLFLPVIPKLGLFQEEPSIYRRTNLQKSAYMMIDENPLFGVGLNNFTVRLEDYLPNTQVLRFIQPVHNIFILIFSEVGIIGLIMFFSLLLFTLFRLLRQGFGIAAVLFVTILQFVVLGSFDHYVFTIHQTQLLFWLTLGLALSYTNSDVEV